MGRRDEPIKPFAVCPPQRPVPPPPQVGRGTSRLPTCSAHANGGAAEVKKRFSLAARHRFFGQAPKKWGRIAGQAINHRPTYRRTRTTRRKGGTPGEGSPLDPLLRSNKHKRVPRSAERGQGRRPCTPPPLKRWTKLSNARVARSEGRKKSGAPERVPDSFIFSRGRRVRRSRRRAPAWSRSSGHRRGASSRSASRRRTAGSAAADARRRAGRSRAR